MVQKLIETSVGRYYVEMDHQRVWPLVGDNEAYSPQNLFKHNFYCFSLEVAYYWHDQSQERSCMGYAIANIWLFWIAECNLIVTAVDIVQYIFCLEILFLL